MTVRALDAIGDTGLQASAKSVYQGSVRLSATGEVSAGQLTVRHAVSGSAPTGSVSITSVRQSRDSKSVGSKLKVTRRLFGFLVEIFGPESKVAFDDKGKVIEYYLPTDKLAKAGITEPNQPFEMDELELSLGKFGFMSGYRFSPLAKAADGKRDPVDLPQEYTEKLQEILHYFGSVKD